MSKTAVLEKQPTEEAKEPFKAPMPEVGERVRWFAMGNRNDKPQPGYVLDVFPTTNMIRLHVVSDQLAPVKTPLHVSDPRIVNQPNSVRIESRGTWDFTVEHYRRMEWERDMVARVEAFENLMSNTFVPESKKQGKD